MRRLSEIIKWKTAASIYAASLEHGRDPSVRLAAREEIIRMGEKLDKAQTQLKEIQNVFAFGRQKQPHGEQE